MSRADSHRNLIAHLFRRAGFGTTPAELDSYTSREYEEIVEDLLHPERFPEVEDDVLRRYFLELNNADTAGMWQAHWVYRMVNTQRPLEEKIALFWHQVFATSIGKSEHTPSAVFQIDTFRRDGLGDLRQIYLDVARDPAMLFWLDNCENHNGAPNENWGRELLELFSMGVGNYTEDDIKNASRAFTGWTFTQPLPLDPYGRYSSEFFYQAGDHDGCEKTFLGETGQFDGEDIIDIVVKQPATARFISRHLFNFFVADEPQVPAWNIVPPRDPEAIETLVEAHSASGGNIRSILRTLFNSDFFKEARFQRVKSPAELVAGTVKLVGSHRFPDPGLESLAGATAVMGQMLMTPPTVEGWHTGKEWIDAGTLNERVNFAVNQLSDVSTPGIRSLIDQIAADGPTLSAEKLVDRCLDWLGPMTLSDRARSELVQYADAGGELRFDSEQARDESSTRLVRMLQTAVSSVEYQFA
jgi:uncharacterized protein (DUF1800 family)